VLERDVVGVAHAERRAVSRIMFLREPDECEARHYSGQNKFDAIPRYPL
jgi:hypothetical protein